MFYCISCFIEFLSDAFFSLMPVGYAVKYRTKMEKRGKRDEEDENDNWGKWLLDDLEPDTEGTSHFVPVGT